MLCAQESVGKYAKKRGLKPGLMLLAVNGEDMRTEPLRVVSKAIKEAGRPLTLTLSSRPILACTIKKSKKANVGFGMTLSPNLRVLDLPKEARSPGPAERAGVKTGLALASVDGLAVRSITEAAHAFAKGGDKIECVFV